MESILSSRGTVLLPSQFPRDVTSKITSKNFNIAKNGRNLKSDASSPPVNWGHGCSGRLQTRDLTVARTSSSVVVAPSSASDDDSPGGFSVFLGLNFGFGVMARWKWIWDGGVMWGFGWKIECALIGWGIAKLCQCDVMCGILDSGLEEFGFWVWRYALDVKFSWEIGWKGWMVNLRDWRIRLSCANVMWWVGFECWLLKNFDDLGLG